MRTLRCALLLCFGVSIGGCGSGEDRFVEINDRSTVRQTITTVLTTSTASAVPSSLATTTLPGDDDRVTTASAVEAVPVTAAAPTSAVTPSSKPTLVIPPRAPTTSDRDTPRLPPEVIEDGVHYGYITGVSADGNAVLLDRVDLLDTDGDGLPDDFRNQNPRLRELPTQGVLVEDRVDGGLIDPNNLRIFAPNGAAPSLFEIVVLGQQVQSVVRVVPLY